MAPDFVPDGSLREVCVLEATTEDWERVLAWLRRRYAPLKFSAGAASAELPARAADVFAMWSGEETPLLAFDVGTILVMCHFFAVDEIEFNIDPTEVTNQLHLDALAEFLHGLARATGKPALLTPESLPQSPILRADPASDVVSFVPPPAPGPNPPLQQSKPRSIL